VVATKAPGAANKLLKQLLRAAQYSSSSETIPRG